MLSPTFRVQDAFPFSICLAWKGAAPESQEGETTAEASCSSVVFPKGNLVPSTKMLTFYRSGTFHVDALYADMQDLPPGTPQKINTCTVSIKFDIAVVWITELMLLIVVPDSNDPSVDMGENNAADPIGMENGEPAADVKPTETEPSKKDASKKKKSKRNNVPVKECPVGALPQVDLQKAVEQEYEMALQDRVMEETKDKKNAVEAYVYEMRNKMYEKYREYATDAEREDLAVKLQETEDWLYEEGEDETKGVYVAKLVELKKLGDPIEERFKEEEVRGPCVEQLLYCINSFREAAISKDPKFDHIDLAEKEKVVMECNIAEEWLRDKRAQQEHLPRSANPVLLCAEVKKKMEALDRFCKPIMTKARPAPPKPASPPPSKGASSKESDGTANGTAAENGDPQAMEPMDADNTNPEGEGMQTD